MKDFKPPLFEMETLEDKYNISLHVEQYEDENIPDKYFYKTEDDDRWNIIGYTIEEAKKTLREIFMY